MSVLLKNMISNTILGDFEVLRRQAKEKRFASNESLPFALAGLLTISGNDLEVSGFRENSWYETRLARSLSRTTATVVARRLLKAHPGLREEVLAHEWIKEHLKTGPLKRLSRDDQAIKSLRALLSDSQFFIKYQQQYLFNWDNGDAQGAMVIVYGWRKAVTKKRGIFQSVSRIHKDARQILSNSLSIYPNNPFLQLIHHRIVLAWDSDARVRRAESLHTLEELTKRPGESRRDISIRLFALKSLIDLGLRFHEPMRALSAINEIEQILVPGQPTHPRIMLTRAWIEALGGNSTTARQLASEIAKSSDIALCVNAAQILTSVGDLKAAEVILNKVTAEFVPHANPLASPTLSIH